MSSEKDKPKPLQRVLDGRYVEVLTDDAVSPLIKGCVEAVLGKGGPSVRTVPTSGPLPGGGGGGGDVQAALELGLAALNAFLQANVTGPVLESGHRVEALLRKTYEETRPSEAGAELNTAESTSQAGLRRACLASLDVDGVSVYPYIPNIELFCLARWIFSSHLTKSSSKGPESAGDEEGEGEEEDDQDPAHDRLSWLRLRVHVWHYRLLSQPNLGPGSIYNRSSRWTEVPSLQELIEQNLNEVEKGIFETDAAHASSRWTQRSRLQFLIEKANIAIMLGWDAKAKAALQSASEFHHFVYTLSGALGKRTKFQEKSISQLVVLAKSAPDHGAARPAKNVPGVLSLNDDTLLERIEFSKEDESKPGVQRAGLPEALKDLSPDNQPQLSPLDQIILLTEATLKDAFSPTDTLTSEEVLPYAERVIADKSTNWQIYTQALLVRSRIELHRSRTIERGVLQMQAVADQVVADTTAPSASTAVDTTNEQKHGGNGALPVIEVTGPGAEPAESGKPQGEQRHTTPTSFFPAAKPAESSPPQVRLRYIHALSTPPRWHLEAELAYAWAGVGSLVSALEIFKRLRLWAEVALCLASSAAADDADGRGSGGEEKARAVLRWRLFEPKAAVEGHNQETSIEKKDTDENDVDISELLAMDFTGPECRPPPPNAPRLFCILGDVESDPAHYERAWELSEHRYSRAQKSLGEYHLQRRDWEAARDAYRKAVAVNRLSPEMWSRLGDINLRLGAFADAADAFGRAIGSAGDAVGGEDARTWSNLGSALYSLYVEALEEGKKKEALERDVIDDGDDDDGDDGGADEADGTESPLRQEGGGTKAAKRDAAALLSRSLAAYKRGAAIAHDNWRIWDNVMTLASRVRPPVVSDILLALGHIITIRNSEEALDTDVLRLLLNDAVLSQPKPASGVPSRGSAAKAVCDLLENDVVPLITTRSELWELVARERVWRGDLAGAIDAAEKAWRAAVGGAGLGGVGGGSLAPLTAAGDDKRNWLVDKEAWQTVVARTDELVSMLENYGPDVAAIGPKWKGKARSALRSVMGKGKENWEGSEGWVTLEGLLEGLR